MNTATGGLNKDIARNSMPQNVLFDAKNIRITADEGSDLMSISNIQGNEPLTVTDALDSGGYSRAGYVIINAESIRDDFILFYAKLDESGFGIIDKLIYTESGFVRVNLYESNSEATNLGFYPDIPFELVSKWTNPNTVNVYFSHLDYPMRIVNVGHSKGKDRLLEGSYTLSTALAQDLNTIPNVNFTTPTFVGYGGGGLITGVNQYSYRLLTESGVYSAISPTSQNIPISRSIRETSSNTLRGGDTAEGDAGVSVTISIDLSNVDQDFFKYIEVFSLHYESASATPTIKIIEQLALSDTVEITDESNEAKFGELDYQEYLAFSSDFSAACLETKDNYLIAANICESQFNVDFDARAYRANAAGEVKVINAGIEKDITVTGLNPSKEFKIDGAYIDETEDVINPYNTDKTQDYKYQLDGVTLGGEGPNVSYNFVYKDYTIDSRYASNTEAGEARVSINGTNEEFILGRYRGLKRGETYRVALVFESEKGVASPAKWIGDIRVPDHDESEPVAYVKWEFASFTTSIVAKMITLNVVVNTAGTAAYGYDYHLVFVPKDDLTREILTEGIVSRVGLEFAESGTWFAKSFKYQGFANSLQFLPTFKEFIACGEGDVDRRFVKLTEFVREYEEGVYVRQGHILMKEALYTLHSPEALFKPWNYQGGLDFELFGMGDHIRYEISPSGGDVRSAAFKHVGGLETFEKGFTSEIVEAKKTTPDTEFTTIQREGDQPIVISNINNQVSEDRYPKEIDFLVGSNITISTKADMPRDYLAGETQNFEKKVPYGRIVRQITPYNGHTWAERQLSVYVQASDIGNKSASLELNRGDTTISYFDCPRIMIPDWRINDYSRVGLEHLYFPVESTINNWLREGLTFTKGGGNVASTSDATIWPALIKEKGNATGDIDFYDDVYSRVDGSRLFLPAPEDFQTKIYTDTKVIHSELNTGSLVTDDWATFKPNNYKLAETPFGPINDIVDFNNELYFFQDDAFGKISVNPIAQVLGEDGIKVALGTGDVLDRFQYVSTEIGSQAGSSVIKSLQALYWLDRHKKKLYKFTGQLESLSDLKGMGSYFKNTLSEQSKLIGVYDNKHGEVLLTVGGKTVEYTTTTETWEETFEQEYYEYETVTSNEDTKAGVAITATTAVADGAWVELDFQGVTKRFTAVNSSPTLGDEFLAGSVETSMESLLESLFTFDTTPYATDLTDNVVRVDSSIAGSAYDLNPSVSNPGSADSAASAVISLEAANEDSYVKLTFTGTTVTFTAKNAPSLSTEWQASTDKAVSLPSLTTAINNWLTTNTNSDYAVVQTVDDITITANTNGAVYDLGASYFNNISGSSQEGNQGALNAPGPNDITGGAQPVTKDNSWIVVDFSSAGGVDRLDLYKNGTIAAQTGVLQGSNGGFPDLDVTPPYITGRLSLDGKDYKPVGAREQYKGEWSSLTSYDFGDIVKVTGGTRVFYVAKTPTTNSNPVGNPTNWVEQPAIGAFDTSTHPATAPYPDYNLYTCYAAYVGTNSQIVQDPPIAGATGLEDGMVPMRYQDYLDAGGPATEGWLGVDGTVIGSSRIRGGVLSHYNDGGYGEARGQRVWIQVDSGDTYEIKVMGGGSATGYTVIWWNVSAGDSNLLVVDNPSVNTPVVSDLAVTDYPSQTVTTSNLVPVKYTDTFTNTYSKEVTKATVVTDDSRYAVLSTETGVDITHKLTAIYNKFKLSENVEYEINGAIFTVTSIDYNARVVYLNLIEGTPTLGVSNMTQFLEWRTPFTLAYSELLNVFTSFYDFIPDMYVKGNRDFFSSNDSINLYKHNSGDRGSFYGTVYDADVDIPLAGIGATEYTNLDFVCRVNEDSELLEDTIHSIKVWSDKGESDEVVLYPKSATRTLNDSEGTRIPNGGVSLPNKPYSELFNIQKNASSVWRTALPRVRSAIDGLSDRSLGGYAIVRLRIKNSGNKRYVLENINIKQNTTWH